MTCVSGKAEEVSNVSVEILSDMSIIANQKSKESCGLRISRR